MADGVHPAVNAVKPTTPDPPVDRAPLQAEGAQLRHRHDAMLSPGERRHAQIPGFAKNFTTVMNFLAHPRNRPAAQASDPSSMTVFPQSRREAIAT